MILFVEGLTVIDCSFLHPDRGLVGESWSVNVSLHGDLDEEGVVFDFSHAKRQLKQPLTQPLITLYCYP